MTTYFPVSNSIDGATLDAGDELFLGFNQSALDTTVNDGGLVDVDGGTAIGTTINGGGVQSAISNGTTSNTVVNGGGTETLIEGSTADGTTVNDGGLQVVDGFCSTTDTTVNAGGFQVLSGNSTAIGTIVSSGGYQIVSSGFFGSPANAIDTILRPGGVIDVTYLAYAVGAAGSLGAGNVLTVSAGGQTYAQTLAGDYAGDYVHLSADGSGGTDVTVNGFLAVSSGTKINGSSYASGHGLIVLSGGSALGITLGDGGSIIVSGGAVVSTTVSSGGSETVLAGGTASGTTIQPGGTEIVSSGGTAISTTVNNGGVQFVSAGGSSLDTIVNSGDTEIVAAGGIATDTIVNTGGLLVVLPGGDATALVSGGAVISSGVVLDEPGTGAMFLGATASGISVSNGATEFVLPGGLAVGTTVSAGGTEAVYADGVASGTDLLVGGVLDIAYLPFSAGGSAGVDGTDLLTVSVGGSSYTQHVAGNYDDITFQLTADAAGLGIDVTAETAAPCYCRGTLIQTEHGEVPVESLRIGDRLVTRHGTARPIRWIGRRSYSGFFASGNREILPVCFAPGALGDGVPRRALFVSPLHAMFLDNALIPAASLVNGTTITQAERVERVDYVHVELDTHDVIFAEGALSETFVDDDSRGLFHNAHEYRALYPRTRRSAARYCAPRIEDGLELEAVRRRLADGVVIGQATADRFRYDLEQAWIGT